MLTSAEGLKPYEIAREHGFTMGSMRRGALERILQPDSQDLPAIYIWLEAIAGQNYLTTMKYKPGSGHGYLVALQGAELDDRGLLKGFAPDPHPNINALTVFMHPDGINRFDTRYYCAVYDLETDNPSRAKIISVDHNEPQRDSKQRHFTRKIARFTDQERGSGRYRTFLADTGLPEEVDLVATMLMYLKGEFEEDGKVVPLTVETIARKPVLAAI